MLPRLFDWLNTPPRAPRAARRRYVPVVEALESRTLLAGNVTAVVEDGNLTLTGDAEDNLVDVTVLDGDLIVQGLDGTTINGSSDPFVAFEGATTVPGDFRASLAGGEDTLRLFGPFTIGGTTRVQDFRGATRLGMTDVTFEGRVHISTGHEADEVSLAGSVLESDLQIKAGGGDNLISVFETSVDGRTSVSSDGAGHWGGFPHCWFGAHRGGPGSLMSRWHHGWPSHHGDWGWGHHGFGWHHQSSGDSSVVIEDSMLGDLAVRTGRGDDNVVVTGTNVDGKVHGWTGRGDDFVLAEDVSVTGRTALHLGAGDDALVTQGDNTFEEDVYASGSCGDDAQQISAETVFEGESKLKHFESTSVDESVIEERGLAALAAAADLRSILNVPGGIPTESDEGFVLV